MSEPQDWNDARRHALEKGRQRVGPPPELETVEALLRGELSEAEAARVRDVLAYYPELVHIMTAEAPAQVESELSDAERDADVARMRQRLGLTRAAAAVVDLPPRRPRSQWLAIAAGLVLAVAIGAIIATQWRQRSPRPVVSKIMIADAERATRGAPAAAVVLDPASDYLLKPLYRSTRAYRSYRLELFDLGATPPRSVWKHDAVVPQRDGSFPATLSTRDLESGDYELVLYGTDDAADRLATYTVRIERGDP